MKLFLIAGARPNFMKIAPLVHGLKDHEYINPVIIHTGQHYDEQMSTLFFNQLDIPEPDINLEVGSASHAVQTARIMVKFEKVCIDQKPDLVMVVGDVNSTVACSLVAAKLNIPIAHYEAGLRSRDRTMPEEINRLVTDAVSEMFFTTSADADKNLLDEGKSKNKIYMVGNLMIDTLVKNLNKIKNINFLLQPVMNDKPKDFKRNFKPGEFGVMTFHRPANVDNQKIFSQLVDQWIEISANIPLIFPIHPRSLMNAGKFNLLNKLMFAPNIELVEPLGYLEFIRLMQHAMFIITDSGGIQEESTFLNIPCLTIRPNTERPVTIREGTNQLIKAEQISESVDNIIKGKGKIGSCPKYWDGKTAHRIVKILQSI